MSKFKQVLTDQDRIDIFAESPKQLGAKEFDSLVTVIEQAVLQSPEIQALRKDAKRLDWLEACEDSHGFCHAGYGEYIYYAHQEINYPTVREVIDTAMEKQS